MTNLLLIFSAIILIAFLIKQKKRNKEIFKNRFASNDRRITTPDEIISLMPKYNLGFEFLERVKNKREKHLFNGNTECVPIKKRAEAKKFYNQAKINGWLYITEGVESVVVSFKKNDFTKILKDNNLPVTGTKSELVALIVKNLGIEKLKEIGEISNFIKLTDLGKEKLNEYKAEFNKQFAIFRQEIELMFNRNEIEKACYYVVKYEESHPFCNLDKPNPYFSNSKEQLYYICSKIKNSDILERTGVPEEYHKTILTTMCMYYSFHDFNYQVKIKEIYNGFEQLLINSDIVINKDNPFFDFNSYIMGYNIVNIEERIEELSNLKKE